MFRWPGKARLISAIRREREVTRWKGAHTNSPPKRVKSEKLNWFFCAPQMGFFVDGAISRFLRLGSNLLQRISSTLRRILILQSQRATLIAVAFSGLTDRSGIDRERQTGKSQFTKTGTAYLHNEIFQFSCDFNSVPGGYVIRVYAEQISTRRLLPTFSDRFFVRFFFYANTRPGLSVLMQIKVKCQVSLNSDCIWHYEFDFYNGFERPHCRAIAILNPLRPNQYRWTTYNLPDIIISDIYFLSTSNQISN